jgi:NADPH:quinone reductase
MHALLMTEPAHGPDRSEVREVPEPRPGDGEVTVDVSYAGVNFLDVMARRGDAGYVSSWPYAPGLEVAGIVREVGAGVTGLVVGQKVAAFTSGGGLAGVALAASASTVPVPDGVALSVAAAAPLMLASAHLLLTDAARFSAGETVLVHSASGGVGSAVAQLVSAPGGGLRIGTVGRAEKVPAARSNGYDVALARDDRLVEAVRTAAGGAVDVVLDPLGTSMLDVDLGVTAPGGRVVLFGHASGGKPGPLPPLGSLIGGNIAIRGFSITRLWSAVPHRAARAVRRVLDLEAAHRLDIAVSEIGSLADVPAVHQLLAEGRGTGKYVARLKPAE